MNSLDVILWERTGIWATAMLRQLPRDVRIVQLRGRADCFGQLAVSPASMVALELTQANLAGIIEVIDEITGRYPWAGVVVLGEPELAAYEPVVREAGAIHVFWSPRELAGWRQTVTNHFGRLPLHAGDFAQSVWDSLPWSDAVTA